MSVRTMLVAAAAVLVTSACTASGSSTVPETRAPSTSTPATVAPATPTIEAPAHTAPPRIALGRGLVGYPNDTQRWLDDHPDDPRTPRLTAALASQPTALWLTGDESFGNLRDYVRRARGGTMVLTLWNIPLRNDGLSAPSAVTAAHYRAWVTKVASIVGEHRALVVLEPDALWFYDRLPDAAARAERLAALRFAVAEFARTAPNARLYVEAGTASGSVTPQRMAALVHAVGLETYAVNVSSYAPAARIDDYAQQVRVALTRLGVPNPRYVVDTSRNGASTWDNTWCNPEQQRLGAAPGAVAAPTGLDFRLWVKAPGTSDGDCGPAGAGAGTIGGQFLPAVAYRMIG